MSWVLVTPTSTSYAVQYSWQASYVAYGYVDDGYVDSAGAWATTAIPSDSWAAQSTAVDTWASVSAASTTWT